MTTVHTILSLFFQHFLVVHLEDGGIQCSKLEVIGANFP